MDVVTAIFATATLAAPTMTSAASSIVATSRLVAVVVVEMGEGLPEQAPVFSMILWTVSASRVSVVGRRIAPVSPHLEDRGLESLPACLPVPVSSIVSNRLPNRSPRPRCSAPPRVDVLVVRLI